MTPQQKLEMQVIDQILSVANEFNEVTYSDLQAIAMVTAQDIIKLVKESEA